MAAASSNCTPSTGQSSSFNCYQLLTPLPTASGGSQTNVDTSNPFPYVISIAEVLVSLGVVLAILFIVYGGMVRMINPGNENKQKEGMQIIKQTILGLLLLAFSYILITTINPNLLNDPFTQIQNSVPSTNAASSANPNTPNSNLLPSSPDNIDLNSSPNV